ncbi:MAG TPA: alkaline shock response membrane anchor protein AmaP [Mycobacteriales bacterium]|jgi:hypothetical protein
MRNRTNRLNRVVLTVIGVILLLAGVGAVLLSTGIFGADRAHRAVVDHATTQTVYRSAGWLWPTVGAVGFVLGILALYWLIVQLRVERIRSIAMERAQSGDLVLTGSALTDAVREETTAVPGVGRARARLTRDVTDPELVLTVWLRQAADLGEVSRQLDDDVIAHARRALARDQLTTWLRIEVDADDRQRVR